MSNVHLNKSCAQVDGFEKMFPNKDGILALENFYHHSIFFLFFSFSDLCWGKAMVAHTMPQQRKKEESEWLRGEGDQIKFIDLGFERWQVVRFRKARGRQDVQ